MFDGEYSFKGSHAEKVIALTAEFDSEKNSLFKRNFDVYMIAPLVGFIYGRRADADKSIDKTTKIFAEILNRERDDLMFNYRLIMLLDKGNEPDLDKRIDKAFRLCGTQEAKPDEELYEEYVRGGIDVIYEKLIVGANGPEDYISNLYDFMEDFDERYNVSAEGIADLCSLARS